MGNFNSEVVEPKNNLEKILSKHSEEFTQELSKSFQNLLEKNPEAAATTFITTIVTTLQVYGGDINKMSEALGIDDRDIAMAEYEFKSRLTQA